MHPKENGSTFLPIFFSIAKHGYPPHRQQFSWIERHGKTRAWMRSDAKCALEAYASNSS
jgi:hypothetical protein